MGIPTTGSVPFSNAGYPVSWGCHTLLSFVNPGPNVTCTMNAPTEGANSFNCDGNSRVTILHDDDDIIGVVFIAAPKGAKPLKRDGEATPESVESEELVRNGGAQAVGAAVQTYGNATESEKTERDALSHHSIDCLARFLTSDNLDTTVTVQSLPVSTLGSGVQGSRLKIHQARTGDVDYLDVLGEVHGNQVAVELDEHAGGPPAPSLALLPLVKEIPCRHRRPSDQIRRDDRDRVQPRRRARPTSPRCVSAQLRYRPTSARRSRGRVPRSRSVAAGLRVRSQVVSRSDACTRVTLRCLLDDLELTYRHWMSIWVWRGATCVGPRRS